MKLSQHIIFEDDYLIAINKPSGLLSIPDRLGKDISLKKLLIDKYGHIFTIHRLDKGTSGLIVFAKTEQAHKNLSVQFEHRQTEKIYFGLVIGSLNPAEGSINVSLAEHPVKKGMMTVNAKGKESLTDYEVIEDLRSYSWVRFRIHTGRTHQIRVHAKHVGHPVACDELYGDGKPILLSSMKKNFKMSKDLLEERPLLDRLALHAFSLKFSDINDKEIYLEAPLPRDLNAVLQQLKKWKR